MSSLMLIVPLRFLSTILTKKLISCWVRIPLLSASITWVLKSEVDIRCGSVKPVKTIQYFLVFIGSRIRGMQFQIPKLKFVIRFLTKMSPISSVHVPITYIFKNPLKYLSKDRLKPVFIEIKQMCLNVYSIWVTNFYLVHILTYIKSSLISPNFVDSAHYFSRNSS